MEQRSSSAELSGLALLLFGKETVDALHRDLVHTLPLLCRALAAAIAAASLGAGMGAPPFSSPLPPHPNGSFSCEITSASAPFPAFPLPPRPRLLYAEPAELFGDPFMHTIADPSHDRGLGLGLVMAGRRRDGCSSCNKGT